MRRRIPVLLGASLLLSGCAAEQPAPTPAETAATGTTATSAGTGATADAARLTVGAWAPADCPVNRPCDVEFRITDLVLTEHCEHGVKPGQEPPAQDTWILTLYSEARAGLTADAGPHLFSTPDAVTADGRLQSTSYDQPCADNPAHSGFEYLLTGVEENSAARFADVLAVPAGSRALLFEGHRIELPAPGETTDAGAGAGASPGPAGTDAPNGANRTGTAEPHMIGDCESDGHALFSDGVRRPVAACPAPARQPSREQFNEPQSSQPPSGQPRSEGDTAPPHTCPGPGGQSAQSTACSPGPMQEPAPSPETPQPTEGQPPTPEFSNPDAGSLGTREEPPTWLEDESDETGRTAQTPPRQSAVGAPSHGSGGRLRG